MGSRDSYRHLILYNNLIHVPGNGVQKFLDMTMIVLSIWNNIYANSKS